MPDPKSDTAPQKNDTHAPPSQAECSKPGKAKLRHRIRLNSKRVRKEPKIQADLSRTNWTRRGRSEAS